MARACCLISVPVYHYGRRRSGTLPEQVALRSSSKFRTRHTALPCGPWPPTRFSSPPILKPSGSLAVNFAPFSNREVHHVHPVHRSALRRRQGALVRTEDRGQRSEDRGQRSEVRGRRSEVRGQRSEVGVPAVTEAAVRHARLRTPSQAAPEGSFGNFGAEAAAGGRCRQGPATDGKTERFPTASVMGRGIAPGSAERVE
jgi:hypothetical protein